MVSGLCIPGVPIIGNVTSGGACGGVDLSDIDMTAERTDPRLIFECLSPRAYYAADGTIQFADPDVWPLEYRDGVVVGRHEPEPQRTNVITDSRLIGAISGSTTDWRSNRATADDFITAPDGGQARLITITADGANSGVYQRSSLLNAGFPVTISAYCKTASICNINAERSGSAGIVFNAAEEWQRKSTVVSGDGAESTYAGTLVMYSTTSNVAGDTFAAWGVQVEAGEFATSPILTPAGSAATRAAAFASVKNPGGFATAIRVHYSDGTSTDIDFPPDGAAAQLPQSDENWGTRYITRIQYSRGF